MSRRFSAFYLSCLALLFLSSASASPVWAQATASSNARTTYVFFQRTHAHESVKKPEVFQPVVSTVQEFLSAHGVAAMTAGNVAPTGVQVPLSFVQGMARNAGATHLLYVVVDRPFTKWLKVTVQCYDTAGQRIWQEEVAEGWTAEFSSVKATQRALNALGERLTRRLGQPGLLQSGAWQAPPEPASAGSPEESGATIRLASGTPVHLMLVESLSSKTARAGNAVRLQVLGDVKVGEMVVIANKAPASATIETAKSARRASRPGSLVVVLNTVTLLNQQQQPVRGWTSAKGRPAYTAEEVAEYPAIVLLTLPVAALAHGEQGELHRGTVLEAEIIGDVLLPRSVIAAAQPPPREPRHDPASVTFYYPDFFDIGTESVWCGKVKLGSLKRGGTFTLTLPPGRYSLRKDRKSLAIVLDVEEGREAYVRVFTDGELDRLAVVPHDVAEIESAGTIRAKARDVVDVNRLDLAKLERHPRAEK